MHFVIYIIRPLRTIFLHYLKITVEETIILNLDISYVDRLSRKPSCYSHWLHLFSSIFFSFHFEVIYRMYINMFSICLVVVESVLTVNQETLVIIRFQLFFFSSQGLFYKDIWSCQLLHFPTLIINYVKRVLFLAIRN